ncbi:hypothetical protein GN244_ATG14089 [Phytophthora infestans]|uniref:Uncharacterized protein n=1 Tax=Phytophthora infestans TaxID=4787 RepID=A0A833W8N7_PHYIN|nr:hypothetical protein GN244_ATG14089 [Phytophthora infestans]
MGWAKRYFEGNADHIWQKLVDHTGKKPTLGGGRSRRRRQRRGRGAVRFNCSSFYKDDAEALDDFKFRQEKDEDASHYVRVV